LKEDCRAFFKQIYKDEEKVLVFGEGPADAEIMLVGEAPGEQEIVEGRPFVGQAGKYLDELLKALGLKREQLYMTYAVKFRPYKANPDTGKKINRAPNQEEIALSKGWLNKEIQIIMPSVVIGLGNVPLKALYTDKKLTIGEAHGSPLEFQVGESGLSFILFPLYHPANIHKKGLEETYLKDLKKLKEYLGK